MRGLCGYSWLVASAHSTSTTDAQAGQGWWQPAQFYAVCEMQACSLTIPLLGNSNDLLGAVLVDKTCRNLQLDQDGEWG